jgi:hypothetical protein
VGSSAQELQIDTGGEGPDCNFHLYFEDLYAKLEDCDVIYFLSKVCL